MSAAGLAYRDGHPQSCETLWLVTTGEEEECVCSAEPTEWENNSSIIIILACGIDRPPLNPLLLYYSPSIL